MVPGLLQMTMPLRPPLPLSLLLLMVMLILPFTAPSCATAPGTSDGTITLNGSTRFNGKPLPGGEVTALEARPGGRIFRGAIREDGGFDLELPPGSYFLIGRSRDPVSGKELFAFWINNPVRLYGEIPVPLILPFVTSTAVPERVPGRGIRGRIVLEGEPVPGAVAAVFLDAGGEFHGPPYAESLASEDDGRFFLDVGPGRYFVMARSTGDRDTFQGPLLRGDLSGFYPHNPVILRDGEGLFLEVPLALVNRPRGSGSLAPGQTILVEGTVTTVTGQPAPDVRVVLYTSREMLGRPAFISSPTDGAGKYKMEVSMAGTYYAAARSVIGRPPETGELMGFYGGNQDHSIALRRGDRIKGVDITVEEVW